MHRNGAHLPFDSFLLADVGGYFFLGINIRPIPDYNFSSCCSLRVPAELAVDFRLLCGGLQKPCVRQGHPVRTVVRRAWVRVVVW